MIKFSLRKGEIEMLLIYWILGYWAVGQTIYRNKVVITTSYNWFFTKLIYGLVLGFILIPWAIINQFRK